RRARIRVVFLGEGRGRAPRRRGSFPAGHRDARAPPRGSRRLDQPRHAGPRGPTLIRGVASGLRAARPAVRRVRSGSRSGGCGVVRRSLPGGAAGLEPHRSRDLHASGAARAVPCARLARPHGLAADPPLRHAVHRGACRSRARHAALPGPPGGVVDFPAAALRYGTVCSGASGRRAPGGAGGGARAPAAAMNPTLGDWRAIAVAPSSGPGVAVKDRHWDLLIVCLTGYVLTVVGRVHQLFSVLEPFRLALLTAGLGIVLYLLDGSRARRLGPILRLRTTRCVLGLALWMAFSIPGALWPGGAFQEFTDEFAKAAIMYVVLAAAPRGFLDVERLTFAYLVAVGTYATVVLSRFSVGADQWRLASLYYYDANDFAALTVMALPLAVYFVVRRGQLWRRLAGATAAVLLAVGFIWAGSRGGFFALLAVGAFLLLRYRAIRVRWRVSIAAVITLVFAATATDTYWEKMSTIVQPKDDTRQRTRIAR